MAKAGGIPPLIKLIHLSLRSQDAAFKSIQTSAAQTLWHLASQQESQQALIDAGAIKPVAAIKITKI